jgi:hypothetical protein
MRIPVVPVVAFAILVGAFTLGEKRVLSHKTITTPIIYKKEIAQIFQRKCFNCHSENNLAMPLTTYELARPWARAIREEVLDREMPPWGAVTGFGHFANDVGLTQREVDIILSWADGGAPSGVLKVEESIPPVYVPPMPMWEAGEPDEVLAPEEPFTIEAGSGLQVQTFEVQSSLKAPRVVKGIAFKPGDRRVVRYAAIYDAKSGEWLWTWTPWHTSIELPEGVGYRLPANAALKVEIGYRAAEETVTDKSEVGLYLADEPSRKHASRIVLAPPEKMTLDPGASAQKVRAETKVPGAVNGLAIWPELGEGARSLEVRAIAPDGVVSPLLWVKKIPAEWPSAYVFRAPQPFAPGTRLIATAYYDNEGDKPLQVQPRVTIVTGP